MHKGFVIAGERSGVGKTMITLALARACMNRGLAVQCFKVGPDFIDPGFHTAVTGRVSRNLDGWMMGREYCLSSFTKNARDADMVIVEGVMGLYDGLGATEEGSSAQIAKWLNLPVVLIIDGSSFARTAGAVVLGLETFDPALKIAGIIFNKVAGKSHFDMLQQASAEKSRIPVLGYIHRSPDWHTPERHLGLVMADERRNLTETVKTLSLDLEKTVLVDQLLHDARVTSHESRVASQDGTGKTAQSPAVCSAPAQSVRIGVARDEAFCFCYHDNIDFLRQYGAETLYFSPLHDTKLPEGVQGLYLPGGYPELRAADLNKNKAMLSAVRSFCSSGKPVYAECGGLLYLLQAIVDQQGVRHEMVGLFPSEAKMLPRLQRFGYVEIDAHTGCPFLPGGGKLRGHEFHYSDIDTMPDAIERSYCVVRRRDQGTCAEGYCIGNVLASYIHLHFASNPDFAKHFVTACSAT